MTVVISATGLWTPPDSISNTELVASFNTYVERYNAEHAADIEAGVLQPLLPSSAEFIEKASGIKHRYVIDKEGPLDINRMVPRIPERPNEQLSLMAEVSVKAARQALERLAQAQQRLRAGEQGDFGELVIAASTIPGEYLLPPILARFRAQHPRIRVRLDVSDSERATAVVLTRDCDLAFVGQKPRDPLAEEHGVVGDHDAHGISARRRVPRPAGCRRRARLRGTRPDR